MIHNLVLTELCYPRLLAGGGGEGGGRGTVIVEVVIVEAITTTVVTLVPGVVVGIREILIVVMVTAIYWASHRDPGLGLNLHASPH